MAISVDVPWTHQLWSSAALALRGEWSRPVPADVGDEFVRHRRAHPVASAGDFRLEPEQLPALAAWADELRSVLMAGDGFVRLSGLDRLDLDAEGRRCFYVAVGSALGKPMLHYGRLYPVVDRGMSYTTQAVPVSMTNAETCFHTDSSSVDTVPDIVGLYCEQPGSRGGDSLVSNALRVHEILRQEAPEVLAILQRPWIRDIVTPGVERTHANLLRNRFPVFAPSGRPGGVLFRYMRYWLEQGQSKAGQPLDAAATRAFDVLDRLLEHPDNVVRFRLEKGDMLWLNNTTLAHNRTAYEDDPGNVRTLQRMWIEVG